MAFRFSFNLFGARVSIPLFGGGKIHVYGNSNRRPGKQGDGNPRLSFSEGGKGISVPLKPNKRRGIGWWL